MNEVKVLGIDYFTIFLVFGGVLGLIFGYLKNKGFMLWGKEFKSESVRKTFLRSNATHDIVQGIGFLIAALWNEILKSNRYSLLITLSVFMVINGITTYIRSRKFS